MLVAPTAAEYRLLGTNERLLAALRSATNGRELAEGKDAWTHDLGSTTASTDMVPWLLLLALLLWPLDVGIRRVSLQRGDVALARTWVGDRWRAWRGPARRTAQVTEMLATKGRAGGAASRAALLRPKEEASIQSSAPTTPAQPTPPPAPKPAQVKSEPATPPAGPEQPASVDTLARLREAKQRRRGN
jgi:hypothetical protein